MPPFVGVSAYTAFDSARVKRDLLLFDQLAIPGLPHLFKRLLEGEERNEQAAADIDWLHNQNLIPEATMLAGDATRALLFEVEKNVAQYPNIFTRLVAQQLRETQGVDSVALDTETPIADRSYHFSRTTLRDTYQVQAFCHHPHSIDFGTPREIPRVQLQENGSPEKVAANDKSDRNNIAIQVALLEFPQPDESVSWEQLLDFKHSDENQRHRLALRRWLSQVATNLGDGVEIAKEIAYLKSEYEAYMHRKQMTIRKGAIEATVVGSASLLESIAKLKLREAAELLFTVQHQRIALLEAEALAPGREITYLIKAEQSFRT